MTAMLEMKMPVVGFSLQHLTDTDLGLGDTSCTISHASIIFLIDKRKGTIK
jgi:hypothetical protein